MAANWTLEPLLDRFRQLGVQRVYLKALSPNDNSKNQVYLGGDFEVLNILPSAPPLAATTGSHRRPIFKAALQFYWLNDAGQVHLAPHAKLILYPQYPEVRFSGYLLGCPAAPSGVMGTTRTRGRILLFGVCADGRIIGYAALRDSPLARSLPDVRRLSQEGVFHRVPLARDEDNRAALLAELCRIARKGWIDSRRLDANGSTRECNAPNCGGYTLESELGISPNGYAAPDYLGWEIKQHRVSDLARDGVGPITLMTPEPSAGYYADSGVTAFVVRYGYPDRLRQDRLNFGGRHFCGEKCKSSSLALTLEGYDARTNRITDAAAGISLIDEAGNVAATWRYTDLMAHWNRKHALAAYVPSMMRKDPHLQYRYGARVRLGIGTDFLTMLAAVASGKVYYDPGIKVENYPAGPRPKKRSQFRISARSLPVLYHSMVTIDACAAS